MKECPLWLLVTTCTSADTPYALQPTPGPVRLRTQHTGTKLHFHNTRPTSLRAECNAAQASLVHLFSEHFNTVQHEAHNSQIKKILPTLHNKVCNLTMSGYNAAQASHATHEPWPFGDPPSMRHIGVK